MDSICIRDAISHLAEAAYQRHNAKAQDACALAKRIIKKQGSVNICTTTLQAPIVAKGVSLTGEKAFLACETDNGDVHVAIDCISSIR